MRHLELILFAALLLLLSGGCTFFDEVEQVPDVVETPPLPTPADTPVMESTQPVAETPEPEPRTITITLWTIPELAPQSELSGGPTLAEQLAAFDNSHPDIRLDVAAKSVSDQGGSLSYLRAGRTVAPTTLPDLIVLPSGRLAEAATDELIFPLDTLLPAEMFDDLYPAALELARVEDQFYGYPFALTNLRHLVYKPTVITRTLPSTWSALIDMEEPGTLIVPAAGPLGAALTLHYYLAAGGTLRNEAGQPALEVEPLTVALIQIQQGTVGNLIDPQSGTTATVEQAWQIFRNSSASMVGTNSEYYLRQRATGLDGNYAFAPLPGPAGPLPPLVNGLTWAISTPDPGRQALAAELLSWLAASQNLGEWTRQSYQLPARSSALAIWPEQDAYLDFLGERLAAAQPFPPEANSAIMLALSEATADVLLQLNSPEGAAEEAVTSLNPGS